MSVQTIAATGQINTFVCTCNITGAFIGTADVTFKRFNGIVTLSIPTFSATVTSPQSDYIIDPIPTVPSEYNPITNLILPLIVTNNSNLVSGIISINANLSFFSCSIVGGGNFTGTSGNGNNTFSWLAASP